MQFCIFLSNNMRLLLCRMLSFLEDGGNIIVSCGLQMHPVIKSFLWRRKRYMQPFQRENARR